MIAAGALIIAGIAVATPASVLVKPLGFANCGRENPGGTENQRINRRLRSRDEHV